VAFRRFPVTDNPVFQELANSEKRKTSGSNGIVGQMRPKHPRPILSALILLLPLFAAAATRQDSPSEDKRAAIPRDSVLQNLPCPDQPQSFKEFSDSFAGGRIPSPSEITGSLVLIGLWLHKDAVPSLNCEGITRGTQLEWTLLANGYSVQVNAIGTTHQTTTFKPDATGSVTFSVDFGGDSSPSFRCRLTRRNTVACFGSPYYDGVEFKKVLPKPISSELPTYPELARYAHIVGEVKLWFSVDEDGAVTQAGIVSGHLIFRDAALSAVKSWRFRPGLMQPSTRYETDFVYDLRAQSEPGEPKLTVSMTDFRRVEVVSEVYVVTVY
jgi:TonB family protein